MKPGRSSRRHEAGGGHPKSRILIIAQNDLFTNEMVSIVGHRMALPELPSALGPQRVLAIVWPNIMLCLGADPKGFKKEGHHKEVDAAFISTIDMLRPIFGNPESMIDAVRNGLALPEGVQSEYLFRFAGRWKERERARRTIHDERVTAKESVDAIFIMHGGGRNPRMLAPEESEELRRRRKQAKK